MSNEPYLRGRSSYDDTTLSMLTKKHPRKGETVGFYPGADSRGGLPLITGLYEATGGTLSGLNGVGIGAVRLPDEERGKNLLSTFCTAAKPSKNNGILVNELFCGGGGWMAGAAMAGFVSGVGVEYNPHRPKLSARIAVCHEVNFPEGRVVRKSVQQVSQDGWVDLPKGGILVASPDCSNFSRSKVNGGESESDIEAAIAVASGIKKTQPQVFVLEQVEKYLTSKAWGIISQALREEGYKITLRVVNFAEYGVPQLERVRMIVVACKEIKFKFPEPKGWRVSWYESCQDLIPTLPESTLLDGQKAAIAEFLKTNPPQPLLVTRVGREYRVYGCDRPAPTMVKSIFTDQRDNERSKFADLYLPDGTIREVTKAVAARFQSFPDWWQPTCGAAIGYAVPPFFSYQLFLEIKEQIYVHDFLPIPEYNSASRMDCDRCPPNNKRHELDRYDSPHWFVTAVAPYVRLEGTIGEVCYGSGILAHCLREAGHLVWGNDINPDTDCQYHLDATDPQAWENFPEADWIYTNPPYGDAIAPILENAWNHAKRGVVLLVRAAWDEPCDDRATWLYDHPYTRRITLPRFKFKRDASGQWKADNSTISAFIWDKEIPCEQSLTIPMERIKLFHNTPETAPSWDEIALLCRKATRLHEGKGYLYQRKKGDKLIWEFSHGLSTYYVSTGRIRRTQLAIAEGWSGDRILREIFDK
jgi:DNA (cytosine-5)-methyltransferase 1